MRSMGEGQAWLQRRFRRKSPVLPRAKSQAAVWKFDYRAAQQLVPDRWPCHLTCTPKTKTGALSRSQKSAFVSADNHQCDRNRALCHGTWPATGTDELWSFRRFKPVVLNLFFTTPPLRTCLWFKTPPNILSGKFIDENFNVLQHLRARVPPVKNHYYKRLLLCSMSG